ncbi:ATP-grasp domain-containing protein [Evansella clarkii]|uniref:ATP-grasp domain-containing protein n=1 Tax=Evansella clarkii TaxID=79879 RepID=UPI0009963881|nr:RimK family alpha-L-glutamate ligase [Evansella clarkii]
MPDLHGWIIYNGNLTTGKFTDYIQWIQRAARTQNIHIEAKANNHLLASVINGIPALAGIKGTDPLPDFVHFADKDLHLARHLEMMGIPLFNSAEAIGICDNKALMHQKLATGGFPVPDTVIAPLVYSGLEMEDEKHIQLAAEELSFPLIVKEAYGSFGQQVYWADSPEQLFKLARQLKWKEYIIQKPITESLGTDLRLNVVGGKIAAAMKRTSKEDFRANVTAGGTTVPYTPSKEETELALSAARAVGADFAGVDLLPGKNGPFLCEVNTNPHIRSIYECTGIDVAVDMVQFIKENTEKRRSSKK